MQQGVKQGKKLSTSVYIILLMFNIAVCFDELVQGIRPLIPQAFSKELLAVIQMMDPFRFQFVLQRKKKHMT